jgi:hypothetical protein
MHLARFRRAWKRALEAPVADAAEEVLAADDPQAAIAAELASPQIASASDPEVI